MEVPDYPIARPRGTIGTSALIRLERRLKVLDTVQCMPLDPGVETFEKDILRELLSLSYPDAVSFDDFGWDFDALAALWRDQPGCTETYLRACAVTAWNKIHEMAQPTRC